MAPLLRRERAPDPAAQVMLPAAAPMIMAGVRLGVGRAVTGMINGEMFIAVVGLGAHRHAGRRAVRRRRRAGRAAGHHRRRARRRGARAGGRPHGSPGWVPTTSRDESMKIDAYSHILPARLLRADARARRPAAAQALAGASRPARPRRAAADDGRVRRRLPAGAHAVLAADRAARRPGGVARAGAAGQRGMRELVRRSTATAFPRSSPRCR